VRFTSQTNVLKSCGGVGRKDGGPGKDSCRFGPIIGDQTGHLRLFLVTLRTYVWTTELSP